MYILLHGVTIINTTVRVTPLTTRSSQTLHRARLIGSDNKLQPVARALFARRGRFWAALWLRCSVLLERNAEITADVPPRGVFSDYMECTQYCIYYANPCMWMCWLARSLPTLFVSITRSIAVIVPVRAFFFRSCVHCSGFSQTFTPAFGATLDTLELTTLAIAPHHAVSGSSHLAHAIQPASRRNKVESLGPVLGIHSRTGYDRRPHRIKPRKLHTTHKIS